MYSAFMPLISLFISCFLLLLGNGLINILLPVRMGLDGIHTDTIGMIVSLYFVGLLLGAYFSINLIRQAGHVRMFAGCLALGAVSILICSLYADPLLWGGMRVVLGFCNACAFTAMESWLSSSANKDTRGKVLALYNCVALSGLFFGQFFMNFAPVQETTLFVVAGIILCGAMIPLVLSKQRGPELESIDAMSLLNLYKASPLGVVSCLISGILYSTTFNLLPIFAGDYAIVDFNLTLYMGVAIFGAFVLQFPVGYLSDRYDRRSVLLCLLVISAVVDLMIIFFAASNFIVGIFIGTMVTSGIIACTYPLSISETFDKLRQGEMVAAMGCLIFTFALGGIIGPYVASKVMATFGSVSMFYFTAAFQLFLATFVLYRMNARQALPVEDQENFVMHSGAMSSAIDFDPRTEYIEPEPEFGVEVEATMLVAETDPAAAVNMALALAKSDPELGVDVAGAIAASDDIDVLRLYEVMKQTIPEQIPEITRVLVMAQPDFGYKLVKKLAEWHPEQVVEIAAEIGRTLPELRVEMARIAVESAPETATQVAEYYAEVLAEEREALRPADRDYDNSEEEAVNIVSQIWESAPEEEALDVAVAMVDAMPESAVLVAEEYMASQCNDEYDEEYDASTDDEPVEQAQEEYQETLELVSRLAEVAPEQAMDIAVAVLEINPSSASEVVDAISAGNESIDGEWVNAISDKPEET